MTNTTRARAIAWLGLVAAGLLTVGCPKSDGYQHPTAKSDSSANGSGGSNANSSGELASSSGGNGQPSGASSSNRSRSKDTGGLFSNYPEAFVGGSGGNNNRPPPRRSDPPPELPSVTRPGETRPSETRPLPEPKPKIVRPPLPKPPTKSVEELTADLKSGDENLRFRAALELGSRGSDARSAVPALKAATRDPSEMVRTAAESALRKIGG